MRGGLYEVLSVDPDLVIRFRVPLIPSDQVLVKMGERNYLLKPRDPAWSEECGFNYTFVEDEEI